jgi:hypothetical protein
MHFIFKRRLKLEREKTKHDKNWKKIKKGFSAQIVFVGQLDLRAIRGRWRGEKKIENGTEEKSN